MKLLFIGAILGAFFSWIIAHWYYKKSTRDLNELFNSLMNEVKEIKPLVELVRQQQNSNIKNEQVLRTSKLIINQFDNLTAGIFSMEKVTGIEEKNERISVLEHTLKEIRKSLGDFKTLDTPQGKILIIKFSQNSFSVTFPVPMRVTPKIEFFNLPMGSTPKIMESSNIGFTVVFEPVTIPVETFNFTASAEL